MAGPERDSFTVLVVEDDEELRETVNEVLRENGFQVQGASNGREALDWLKSHASDRVCLILLDVMMPIMDGRGFRLAQLADPELAPIPVVLFSAHQDVAQMAAELRVTDFIVKPPRLDRLLDTVAKHCPCMEC
ncbi:MAG: response regulator [Myxococcota bacterium]